MSVINDLPEERRVFRKFQFQRRPGAVDWAKPDRIKRLVELWAAGVSGREIAADLGDGISRSAVLARARRMGLKPRAVARAPKEVLAEPIPKKPPAPIVEEDPLILDDGSHATVLTINDRMCRWPIGDPSEHEFHFCGRAPVEGRPYCPAHAAKAYDAAGTALYAKRVEAAKAAVKRR